MARLVIISNRVPVPGQRGQAAGGLAVALHNAAHQRDCLWFGWSGNVTNRETPLAPRIAQSGRMRLGNSRISCSQPSSTRRCSSIWTTIRMPPGM